MTNAYMRTAWATGFALVAVIGLQSVARAQTPGPNLFAGAAGNPAKAAKVGVLRRNYGDDGGEAPWVLVDETGRTIQADVLPVEGLDLSEFDGQKVRIGGTIDRGQEGWLDRINASEIQPLDSAVEPAQAVIYDGPVDGGVISDGGMVVDGGYIDGGYVGGPEYHVGGQPPLLPPHHFWPLLGLYPHMPPPGNGMGPPHWFWVRAEYLGWATRGLDLPPLVTTSPDGTARANAGVLGTNGVQTLFGGEDVLNDYRNGGRIRFGMWINPAQSLGVEGEYLALEQVTENFFSDSNGSPILARPFFNALTNQEDSELVAFPDVVTGSVRVQASGDFQSAGVRARMLICCPSVACDPCASCGGCDPCGGCGVPVTGGVNFLAGYRFLRLDEGVTITEDLNSAVVSNPGSFLITDQFNAENEFHGAEFGMLWEMRRDRWFLELLSKVAFGVNNQTVSIRGETTTTVNEFTDVQEGGILALRTNSGLHERDEFTMIPELGVTLGCHLTPRLAATVGYTFIYWPHVVRPGEIIDTTVNPQLFPPEQTVTGALRPEFAWNDTDFWAQGLSLGLDYRW